MEPTYERFESEVGYLTAIDFVLANASSTLRIFDADLAKMHLEKPERIALLGNFLSNNVTPQLRIVVRNSESSSNVASRSPRLIDLLARYSHFFGIRQAPASLQHLADCHVIADSTHCVRRFHIDHARGSLITHDEEQTLPWSKRFDDLWELSQPWSGAARLTL
ncbi:MAG: hypothetical protein KA388_03055 [Rhodocyclaceae bacterium]|nr:hypothetical protein [Rhodocyclaceae bacterium]MBK9625424.1 hypothetical protein [Rhodocyclaceae bacterium]MBL0077267.1 hypothetical protein [Rhodocyclaceae bacterium]MBP6109246.1 hypothetical protein [Rhodocyclaceae bacterium]MBP6278717.1 hypothetical protein [Rhodocyclaceae bacterium]